MKSYLLILLLFAIPASVDLAIIRREGWKDRLIYGIKVFLYMTVGSIAFGWFMYVLR